MCVFVLQRTLNSHIYSLSPDLNYVMITHDVQKVFRHSTLAKYTFQSLKDRSDHQLFFRYLTLAKYRGIVPVLKRQVR
jgi:mannosyltransferase OCH1-like enzyme